MTTLLSVLGITISATAVSALCYGLRRLWWSAPLKHVPRKSK